MREDWKLVEMLLVLFLYSVCQMIVLGRLRLPSSLKWRAFGSGLCMLPSPGGKSCPWRSGSRALLTAGSGCPWVFLSLLKGNLCHKGNLWRMQLLVYFFQCIPILTQATRFPSSFKLTHVHQGIQRVGVCQRLHRR